MEQQLLRTCPGCGAVFTLREIVESPRIKPLGMQFVDEKLEHNVFFFNHVSPTCGTTFVVPVTEFLPFITERIPEIGLAGSEDCEKHCLAITDLAECNSSCRYAPYRRFLLSLMKRDRRIAARAATSRTSL